MCRFFSFFKPDQSHHVLRLSLTKLKPDLVLEVTEVIEVIEFKKMKCVHFSNLASLVKFYGYF